MRDVTIGWVFCVIWMSCVMGSRRTIFARALGFAEWQLGLMQAIASAAVLCQFVGVMLVERTGLRKYHFLYYGVASRALWVGMALIPLVLPVPSGWAVGAMLILLAASSALAALIEPAWHTWMGDLIPRRIRGRYFATRSRWSTVVKIPLILTLAVSLDAVKATYGPDALLRAICLVFALAGVCGMLDILRFRRIRDVVPAGGLPIGRARTLPSARGLLLAPLRDRDFRRYVFYGACMTFALMVSHSYFFLFMIEGLSFGQSGTDLLFMVLGPIAGLLAVKGWGKLMDRWGRRPVLMLATGSTVLSILPYFFASTVTPNPQFVIEAVNAVASLAGSAVGAGDLQALGPDAPVGAWLVMSISMILGGAGWSGVMLAQQGIILGFADTPGRGGGHVAAYRVLTSLGGLAGGLIGSGVVWLLADRDPIVLGPLVWNQWHGTFALSWLARAVGLISLIGMPDPGSRRFRDMTRHIGTHTVMQVTSLLSWPFRAFGVPRINRTGPDDEVPPFDDDLTMPGP